jgi:DNA polymerase III sliding clamp (beta) subunit (PCNA family)
MQVSKSTLLSAIKLAKGMNKKIVTKEAMFLGVAGCRMVIHSGTFELEIMEVSGSVDAELFVSLDWVSTVLSVIDDEVIDVETEVGDTKVSSGKFFLGSHNTDDVRFFVMMKWEADEENTQEVECAPKHLKRVQAFLSRDNARPNLTHVFVAGLQYVSADGHTLAAVEALTKEVKKSYMISPEFVEGLIRSTDCKLFLCDNNAKVMELQVKDDSFRVKSFENTSEVGSYPDFKQVIPKLSTDQYLVKPSIVKEVKALQDTYKKLKLRTKNVKVSINGEGGVLIRNTDEGIVIEKELHGLKLAGSHSFPVNFGVNHEYFFTRMFSFLDPKELADEQYHFNCYDSLTPLMVSNVKDVFVVMPMRL